VRRSSGAIARVSRHHIKTATKEEGPHLRSLFCIKRMCRCDLPPGVSSRGVQLEV